MKIIIKMLTLSTICLFVFCASITVVHAACTGSSPNWNSTPDYESVSSCVSQASVEDTVNVSAGTATWSKSLTITKGINLIGSGVDNTVININVCDSGAGINYSPTSSNCPQNYPFRLSGFTLNQTGPDCNNLSLNSGCTTKQKKVRIDHNKFTNANSGGHAISATGPQGVVDNNTFYNVDYPIQAAFGDYRNWDNWGQMTYGAGVNNEFPLGDNLYFEDNVFTGIGVRYGFAGTIAYSQFSTRYAFRYNTFIPVSSAELQSAFDFHGNEGADFYSSFGGEIYGNKIIMGIGKAVNLVGHRGGKLLMFYNNILNTNSVGTNVREEQADSNNPTANQPQHVNNTYIWNNRKNTVTGELVAAYLSQDCCTGNSCTGPCIEDPTDCCYNGVGVPISENIDWFNDAAAVGGSQTKGVGCGTLANRPTNCMIGTGYWATDQSCTDLSGLTGATGIGGHTRTSNVTGTLYKCTAANTWTEYYKPLAYPHPLRRPEPPRKVWLK